MMDCRTPGRCGVLLLGCLFGGVLAASGCAVVEPGPSDTEQVRVAVEEDPAVPIAQLGRELGVSYAAVVAALPEDRRRRVPADEVTDLLAQIAEWGEVELAVQVLGHGLVYRGRMPAVAHETTRRIDLATGERRGLSMAIAKRDIATVWLLRYPGGAHAERMVVFCEALGEPWLTVRVKEKGPGFDRAWERYAAE